MRVVHFWRARRAVISLEVALLAPAFALAGFTGTEFARAFIIQERVQEAAASIAEIATAQAAAADGHSNDISVADVVTASSAIFAYFPSLTEADAANFGVTMTSLVFKTAGLPCKVNCTTAHVAWTGRFQGSLGDPWTCDGNGPPAKKNFPVTTQSSDAIDAAADTVPKSVVSSKPTLAILVYYRFQPSFASLVVPGFTITRGAYFSPRQGQDANWTRLDDPGATPYRCKGYS